MGNAAENANNGKKESIYDKMGKNANPRTAGAFILKSVAYTGTGMLVIGGGKALIQKGRTALKNRKA